MPNEHLNLLFRPVHFFTQSPCMDVPGANDKCSVPAFPNESNSTQGQSHCH